jgi:hypothetical protein
MARDRVFMLQWSAPVKTALNGGFAEFTKVIANANIPQHRGTIY